MVSSVRSIAYKHNNNINNAPVHNPIVRGNFTAQNENLKELSIFRFNRFLSFSLLATIVISMISYSIVVAKENQIIAAHNRTNEISYENIELQNKVDYARSYYNVNDKVSKVSFLQKPEKVLEVNAVPANIVIGKNKEITEIKPIAGY